MIATFAFSRLTGLLRDIAVAYQFGTGREMDAYLAAIKVPDLVFQVFAGGAVSSAFIPVFAGLLARRDEAGAWRMVSTLLNLSVLVLSPVIVVLILFATPLMSVFAAGFDPETQALSASLARILMVSPLCFTLGCFVTSVLNANQRFFLAALAPVSYNVGIIAGALVLAPTFGVAGLAVGAVLGSVLFLLVQTPGLPLVGMRYQLVLDLASASVRQVGRLMLPRAWGLAVAQAGSLAVVVLASPTPGAIAALNYGQLLMMLPLGIFAMAISQAVFPRLAIEGNLANLGAVRAILGRALGFVLFLTLPSAVALVVIGEPIVRVLWERGQFGAGSTAMTVTALRLYAPGLVALAVTEVVSRVFYAYQDTRTPVLAATAAMTVNLIAAYVLTRSLSFGGLALAATIGGCVEAGLVVRLAFRLVGNPFSREVVVSVVRTAGATLCMAVALVAIGAAFGERAPAGAGWLALVWLAPQLVGGGLVFLGAAALLRSEEVGLGLAQVRGLAGRLGGRRAAGR